MSTPSELRRVDPAQAVPGRGSQVSITRNPGSSPTATHSTLGYNAKRHEDGSMTVYRVPIFVECKRGDTNYDADWIARAVAKAMQSEREGHLPPLHIRHHDKANKATDAIRPAGFFRVLGTEIITFKGQRRVAVMADLIVTNEYAQGEVLAKRLPWRSVEIFDVEDPALDSLALLDHEAPYLELPMLMVNDLDESAVGSDVPFVASATFDNPWLTDAPESGEPVVACFSRGPSRRLFFQDTETTMAPTPDDNDKPKGEQNANGDDKPKDNGDNNQTDGEGGLDVGAVVKAISDGSISVADMDAILEAIQAQRVAHEEPEAETPAPAAAPGAGEAMTKDNEELAEMRGKVVALEAWNKQRDADEIRKTNVAEAMQRVEGRPMGSDVEENFVAFHKEHGAEAFAKHVDTIVKTFATLGGGNGGAESAFMGHESQFPDVAMAYQEHGTQAVDRAAHWAAEWTDLKERNHVRQSQERYVAINMEKEGVKLKAQTA